MTTFLEIAAQSVDNMFSLHLAICNISFGFEDLIWVLNASVPDLCILFTIYLS